VARSTLQQSISTKPRALQSTISGTCFTTIFKIVWRLSVLIPVEDPKELWIELNNNLKQLENLIYRINVTNMHTVHKGQTLTKLIAAKDVLALRVSIMREVLKHTVEREDRFGRQEIKYVRTVDAAELRREVDSYSRQLRELDVEIQSLNWAVDLE
jgi:hypothetical protein